MTLSLKGIGISRGIAIGPAHLLHRSSLDIPEYTIDTDSIPDEIARFRAALRDSRRHLRAVNSKIPHDAENDIRELVDIHLLMLSDSTLIDEPIRLIKSQSMNAELALDRHRKALSQIFDNMDDPYLSARNEDLNQVIRLVQKFLKEDRRDDRSAIKQLATGQIMIADDISPADLALLFDQKIAGFISEHGGRHSHTAILARSLRIPAVLGVENATELLLEEEHLIIDGEHGVVIADANKQITNHYERSRQAHLRYYTSLNLMRNKPSVTRDNREIKLMANVELPQDLTLVKESGRSGIGLYRTEFLFMNRSDVPCEQEQFEAYKCVIDALDGEQATIRTLDLGADKQVDGISRISGTVSTNPALGLRAIRLCLNDIDLFKPQIRAILRASALGPVRLMIPMLTNGDEVFQAINLIEICKRELKREKVTFDNELQIGGMIEVPAAAISAKIFAKHLDFLSIGTNDLIQYTLAIDRIDESVSYLYDPVHPAILSLIKNVIDIGEQYETPVAMCGEMAGDVRYTRLLLGLGLREFSMQPGALLEVKKASNNSNYSICKDYVRRILRSSSASKIQSILTELNEHDMNT